jgi:predicted HicB family RNase H-like nuclease
MSQREAAEDVQVLAQDLATVRLSLRLPRGLHQQQVDEAKKNDLSLNQFLVFTEFLREAPSL